MINKLLFFLFGLMVFVRPATAQPSPHTLTEQVATSVSDSIARWKSDKDFQYMNRIDSILKSRSLKTDTLRMNEKGRVQKSNSDSVFNKFLNLPAVKVILTILAVGFIIFIVYRILSTAGFFRIKRRKGKPGEGNLEITEPEDFQQLAVGAEAAGNYKLATRYCYLQLLKLLTQKNLIQFSTHKTNVDYVQQLKRFEIHDQFKRITLYYEYIWYGEFALSAENWQSVKTSFIQLTQKINDRY